MSKATPVFLLVIFHLLGPAVARAGELQPDRVSDAPLAVTLTLTDARQRALETSPELQALAARVQAAEGASRQARAFANPELVLESEDFGGDSSLDVTSQSTFAITQSVEWFGKRSARVEAARLERDVAAHDLARARRDLVAEVDRAFATLLGAQETAAIAEQNAQTAREVTRAVSALVAAGEVSPIEEARAQADEALASVDLANTVRDVDLARRALARLWGEGIPSFSTAAGTLATTVLLPDRDEALAALAALPDLTRWDAEAARQASLVTLASRRAFPDLTLSVGTRSYSGHDGSAYVAGLVLPIPLWTQFAGARAEAFARQEQAKHDRRADEVRIRVELLTAYETLSRAVDEARALRDEVLPRASTVYEALNEGYRRGKFRLLDLLEARRTLALTRLRYVDALARLSIADADLRRFIPDDTLDEDGGQQ